MFRQDLQEIYLAQRRRGAEEFLDRIDRIKKRSMRMKNKTELPMMFARAVADKTKGRL